MLQVFYLDVCVCLQWFSIVFASVSDSSFKRFSFSFFYVASVASGILDVSKVVQVFHMRYAWEAEGDMSSPHVNDVQATWAPRGRG